MAMKKYPKAGGPMVEFYLAPNENYKKGEAVKLDINGFEDYVVVGQRNKLPKQALQVLLDAKSTATRVPDLSAVNPDMGGVPRKQEDFYRPKESVEYQHNFDIEVLSEASER